MTTSFTAKVSTLRAVARFASKDKSRFVICSVRAECEPGKTVQLVATDGRRLIIHETKWRHDAEQPESFEIPTRLLRCFGNQFDKSESLVSFNADLGEVSMDFDGLRVSNKAGVVKYPTYRSLIPVVMPKVFPAKSIFVNANFLSETAAVLTSLSVNKLPYVEILGEEDPGKPIIVKTKDTTILLMLAREI